MKNMRTRNDFAPLLCRLGLIGNAAEIGVAEGYFSFHLLDRWPGVCFLIDPWRKLDIPGYSVHGDHDQEARYSRVLRRARDYKGRARVHRATSAEAAVVFEDEFFDFVYIDANHSYESTSEDLRLWWPKIKHGGIFGGHDYLDGIIDGVDYGVKRAVTEFVGINQSSIRVTEEKDWPSWWFLKP